jgi:hypothetical protein
MKIYRFVFEDILLDKRPKQPISIPHKNLHVFTPEILKRIGQLKNAGGGMLATLPIPVPLSLESFTSKRYLILDGLQDLGELGTIIRSASAFDWEAVWITHSCADPFDPVCIRSSQGALFQIPYRVGSIENALKHSRKIPGILKLKHVPGQCPKTTLGIHVPDLTEAKLPVVAESVCLLIQRNTKETPASTDFIPIGPGPFADPDSLSLSVSASSLMYTLRDRYFSQ